MIKLLIIEDEASLRETWNLMLSHYGFLAHTAANGSDGVKIIQEHPIEIIVTDLQMPIEDGYFVLEYLKSNNLNIKTRVCTGHTSADLQKYNIDKIILKPFDMLSEVKEIISIFNEDGAST
jgi:DNA-binding NtrC family response regulator